MMLWLINSVNVCADRYCKGEAKYGKNTNATRRWTYICDMRIRCQEQLQYLGADGRDGYIMCTGLYQGNRKES